MKWYFQLSRWPWRSSVWLIVSLTARAVVAGTSAAWSAMARTADLCVALGPVERTIECVDELGVLCVGRVGSVEGDRCHRSVDRVEDRVAAHGVATASVGFGSLQMPAWRATFIAVLFRLTCGTLPGQSEHSLADDVALDLVRARPDRAGLVVEPRALPPSVAGVVLRPAPQRRLGSEHCHDRVVESLAHLAPPELVDAADGAGRFSLGGP